VKTAEWRQARARAGGEGRRKAFEREREARGERYATKGVAYVAGYRAGYYAAMRWWALKVKRERAKRAV
jgi:hypothetical protein